MKTRQRGIFLAVLSVPLLALGTALPAVAAGDPPPPGRLLASQCAQCHGTNGKSVGEIDSLAGKSFGDLYGDLLDMKYSGKLDDMMHRQAKGYTVQQLELIAKYFAAQPSAGGGEEEHDD